MNPVCIKMHPKAESTLDKLWERIFVGKEAVDSVANGVTNQVNELMAEMK